MPEPQARWAPDRARAWSDAQPWRVGSNFLPSTAGNQLEMWQAETFDPETMDRELGFAAAIGMNAARVYLHDLAFHADRDGLFDRMERCLAIADGHGIATMFVFLDDCWSDDAAPGPQPEPIPGVHNSTWLRCPAGRGVERAFHDEAYRGRIEAYVAETMDRFREDGRVWAWDLYNEPLNPGKVHWRHSDGTLAGHDYRPVSPRATLAMVHRLFDLAAEVDPSQPATVGLWRGDWEKDELNRVAAARSDVPSFHCYGDAEKMARAIDDVARLAADRPMICTEYMARTQGSTFASCLPVLRDRGVDAVNWGLVAGRSNTIYPWSTADAPGKLPEPDAWFHDVLRRDGTPYDPAETALIAGLTGAATRR